MAKSLRSKIKRKMRAVKRVKYGKKELDKLMDTVAKLEGFDKKLEKEEAEADTDMPETRVPEKSERPSRKPADTMDVDLAEGEKIERVYSQRTMKDQFGNYPQWMNSRKIHSLKDKSRKLKRGKKLKALKRQGRR